MSTQITKKDLRILIILAGAVVFIICYLLVYNKLMDKKEEVDAKIEELTPQLEQYKEYAEHKEEYEEQTAAAKENIAATMAKLPSSYNPEDVILYTTGLETSLGIDATALTFTDPVSVVQFTGVTPDNIDDTSAAVDMTAYETQTTVNTNLDYVQLKNLINSVYTQSETLTGIDSVSVTYDAEKAALTGTVVLDKFYLTYPDAPEYTTNTPATTYGAANPFGTIETGAPAEE